MKVYLTKFRHYPALSEETTAYSAVICVDGVEVADATNEGHGGADHYRPRVGQQGVLAALEAWATTLPPRHVYGTMLPSDLESVVADLITRELTKKDAVRAMKNKVLYKKPEDSRIFAVSWKGVKKVDGRHIANVRQSHPSAIVLNEMPIEDVIDIYLAAGV